MKKHSVNGCNRCSIFLDKFFPHSPKLKVNKSVKAELMESIEELFTALKVDNVMIENELEVTVASFAADFIKMCDEIKSDKDIVELWHIDPEIASKLFDLFNEVVFGILDIVTYDQDSESDSDVLDESTDDE